MADAGQTSERGFAMTKQLPPKPSLEHLSNQAKDILKAQEKGDSAVCDRLRLLRRFSKAKDADILSANVPLADAQFVVAMEYGFTGWADLRKLVLEGSGKTMFAKLEDLDTLSNRSIEVLLRDVDRRDIALAFAYKEIPVRVSSRFYRNMSRQAHEMLQEDWKSFGSVTEEQKEEAVQRILETANRFAGSEPDFLKGGDAEMKEWEAALDGELQKRPANTRTSAELAPVFVELVRVARREGLVALDEFVDRSVNDELMKLGLRWIVDGADVQIVREMLEAKKATLMQAYERRLSMIIAGCEGIGTGLSPHLLEEKCKAFLQ